MYSNIHYTYAVYTYYIYLYMAPSICRVRFLFLPVAQIEECLGEGVLTDSYTEYSKFCIKKMLGIEPIYNSHHFCHTKFEIPCIQR
jgi:hypothetical protein